MDEQLAGVFAIIIGASLAYAQGFGARQMVLSEWVITALRVPTRYKGLTNLAVSEVLALMLSAFAVWYTGEWYLLGLGALAGVLASVDAAKEHDRAKGDTQ